MSDVYIFFVLLLLIVIINFFFKKNFFLCSLTGDSHQKFTNVENVPLTGGIFLYLALFFFLFKELNNFQIFIFLIFLIGLLSDLNFIKSPEKRFLFQFFIVFFSIYFNNLTINNTGVDLLDYFLDINFFNYFFVTFCVLIIVNGTNFLDGLNTLVTGYFLIILFILIKLDFSNFLGIESNKMYLISLFLGFIFFSNLLNKMFLGDSGSYLLGFIVSIFLVTIYSKYNYISSFFIVLLLWYPSFENLFSLIRKISKKKSPLAPDKNHLHQLLFYFIRKKNKYSLAFINGITAQVINVYNLLIFLVASNFIYSSQVQILLIIFNIIVYVFLYTKLFNFKYEKYLKRFN